MNSLRVPLTYFGEHLLVKSARSCKNRRRRRWVNSFCVSIWWLNLFPNRWHRTYQAILSCIDFCLDPIIEFSKSYHFQHASMMRVPLGWNPIRKIRQNTFFQSKAHFLSTFFHKQNFLDLPNSFEIFVLYHPNRIVYYILSNCSILDTHNYHHNFYWNKIHFRFRIQGMDFHYKMVHRRF